MQSIGLSPKWNEGSWKHVLPSFIIAQGLDFLHSDGSQHRFECFECLKGSDFALRGTQCEMSEVVYEGHPVVKSRVSAHRERPMEIRVEWAQEGKLSGDSEWGKGLACILQTDRARKWIWSEFQANDKARYKLLRRHALNPFCNDDGRVSMPQWSIHRQIRWCECGIDDGRHIGNVVPSRYAQFEELTRAVKKQHKSEWNSSLSPR